MQEVNISTTEKSAPAFFQDDQVQRLKNARLTSDQIDIDLCEIREGIRRQINIDGQSSLDKELTAYAQQDEKQSFSMLVIPQQNSRGPFKITADGLQSIFTAVCPSPTLTKTVAAFATGSSDCYIGRSTTHFRPLADGALELCCLLKYVERNGRAPVGPHAWSLRQMALYQLYIPNRRRQFVMLFNPSIDIRSHIANTFDSGQRLALNMKGWTRAQLLLFPCLVSNWSDYITTMHEAVDNIRKDALFTNPRESLVGEVTEDSLKKCATYFDLLHYASHALRSNITTLSTIAEQATKRNGGLCELSSNAEVDELPVTIDELAREMHFADCQIDLIKARLEHVTATIRDATSLRASYSIERMTAQSLTEARTVRIIALITLVFLPPTLTTSFLDMDYLNVTSVSASGMLSVESKPEMWLFLALTVPLLFVTVSGWVWWNWREEKMKKGQMGGIWV